MRCGQLIESALEMFGAQAAERGIALRMSVAGDVPDELYADPGRLRQVMINLLSNAVKFAMAGEVRVHAETQLRRRRASCAWPCATADRSSRRMIVPGCSSRSPASKQPGGEGQLGTGLGLAICHHLVTLMGGEIGCDVWTVGRREAGNEFWLMLP